MRTDIFLLSQLTLCTVSDVRRHHRAREGESEDRRLPGMLSCHGHVLFKGRVWCSFPRHSFSHQLFQSLVEHFDFEVFAVL